jgi:methionyl-tRNA synthetase
MMNNLANSFGAMPMFGLSLGLFTLGTILFFALIVCVTILKGYALWTAAKRDEVGWFIALLIINTFGILELIYLYFVVGKWKNHKH